MSSALNGNRNHMEGFPALPVGKWNHIGITQQFVNYKAGRQVWPEQLRITKETGLEANPNVICLFCKHIPFVSLNQNQNK